MEHTKTFFSITKDTTHGTVYVEGPVPPETLATYSFHEDLVAFRPPTQQHKAIVEIAGLPEGRIIIMRNDKIIVGYVTYLYPDPLERWAEDPIENMIELGAIEVAPAYRGTGAGKALLAVSFMDDKMEDYLVITTEYYWHWDLKGTGLSVWDYRKVMEKMMSSVGFEYFATDDPEITSHPANCLMAREGKHVSADTMERFDQLRFRNRFMY
ncbi:GNAT family N-acetyltransferase [Lysinibacillus piscis]|uniref:Acetoin utilization protein AcuA n=1 Tax=Lysinibacillus piscis TaxID=2518931 RepID=A0ABQ5NIV4_9BACI|nr:GNAT family N-acetyltransferase [Lysinibacillus sp. KH24]GLC88208.1 acetoin utilization protein AcuA [Lysinibacillus sp. KH24]